MMNNSFEEIQKSRRNIKNGHKSMIVWLTGYSGAGKSTLANSLEIELFNQGYSTYVLDGDKIRKGINIDLGFSIFDRKENIRRAGEIGKLLVEAGIIVIATFISPIEEDRRMLRKIFSPDEFILIFVDCPLAICEERDVKGLYKKARNGDLLNFTGIDSQYEIPTDAEIIVRSSEFSINNCLNKILDYLGPKLKL